MQPPLDPQLLATLPPTHRLALAYAPAKARNAWMAVLALDAKLATIVRATREPVLGQLRLAWWRDRLKEQTPPRGEPVLSLLKPWGGVQGELTALVDGWEALLGEAPLQAPALSALAMGRGSAMAALATHCGAQVCAEQANGLGYGWGLVDVAAHLSHPQEQDAARRLVANHDWTPAPLPPTMRPLVVLHGFARRQRKGASSRNLAAFAGAIRLGIFGR